MTRISVKNIEFVLSRHIAELTKKIQTDFPKDSKYSIADILGAKPQKLDEIARWFDSLHTTKKSKYGYIKTEYGRFHKQEKRVQRIRPSKSVRCECLSVLQ